MATDKLEEGTEVTPEAFEDLQKRLAKAEKKLAKAKSRAQATMQEIWQLDVKLKEEEERANEAVARLEELQEAGAPGEAANDAPPVSELQDEIETLRDELKRAREEASQVAELETQIATLQQQVEEAGPPSSEADESELQQRFDALEDEKSTMEVDFQVRIAELENELSEAREAAPAEGAALSDEAATRIADLEVRIAELEAELEQARATAEVDVSEGEPVDEEFGDARVAGLRIALHEAEERARKAESRITGVGDSTSAFEDQLEAIQAKVKEAEERALEWEEKFHRSEERAIEAEQDVAAGSEGEDLLLEFQDRISELETELAEARQAKSVEGGADGDDAGLREELQAAQDKLAELEGQSGVSLEKYQRLEKELEDFQQELEEANKRADKEARRADAAIDMDGNEALAQFKERLELSDERAELFQQKASQAAEKLDMVKSNMEDLKEERDALKSELKEAKSTVASLTEQLEQQAGHSEQVGLSSAAVESKLQDALARARESDLKANQAEIQLQKAMESLSEYEQRANESDRETQRLAFQDGLTGLPNLNLIRQYLEFTVKQVQRYSRASALLVVDLDRFKLINDAMGFKAGDELLTKVAERLQTAIRESDALGRKGEDEFLILLSELVTGGDETPPEQKTNMIRQNIAIVVNRISECLSRPFHVQGQKFYIRASIGVSICPNDAETAQEMLEHADSAMYHAKESGRGRCVFYNNELHKRQERRLTMDSQLRLAMEKGEFVLQYQPIIEITKGRGTIVGVEALLRWNHRIDGLLEPASFLTIAEETGLIVQLGQWVCRQSCWQLRQWLSQGHNLFVSFNVSTRQMLQADLAEMILSSVDEFGLQPGLVFVEISEGSNVEEVDLIERVVGNLGRAGIRVAIDDFGVGYSSISRIDLQHIQFLKIDPSLVNGCQQDRAKANICEAAVRLGESLELRPLAEGVETLAQAKFLAKIGCQFMQGYHIQAPCDAVLITKMLEEKTAWKF